MTTTKTNREEVSASVVKWLRRWVVSSKTRVRFLAGAVFFICFLFLTKASHYNAPPKKKLTAERSWDLSVRFDASPCQKDMWTMDMIRVQKLEVDLQLFSFFGVFFLFQIGWFCFGSLLCRFVGTLGFFSCDVVYNVSDIFAFWFWLTRDFSLDNDVLIHDSSPGFDGDRLGRLVLYVWHFSLDTIFCELSLRSSFQL